MRDLYIAFGIPLALAIVAVVVVGRDLLRRRSLHAAQRAAIEARLAQIDAEHEAWRRWYEDNEVKVGGKERMKEGTYTLVEIMAALPVVKSTPAFAGCLPTFIAATVAQAVREAAEPPHGTIPMLVMRPAGEVGWMHVGDAKRLRMSDIRNAQACVDDGEPDCEIEVGIIHLTQEEIDATPEFDGW
jgi:hypothetical protein